MAVNGRAVRGSPDLRNQIGLMPAGDEVEFKVLRDSRERLFKARVEAVEPAEASGSEPIPELAGASVGNAERSGRSEAVAVVDVTRGSPAWTHGLRAGDLIAGVNRTKVRSVAELLAALKTSGPIVLTVLRGDAVFAVVVRR